MSTRPPISLAYSTDSDDAFMFWALRPGHERVDVRGLTFTHARADTETLNQAARAGTYDVCAISIATYPAVADTYRLLPHGGSVGVGYGPVVVAREPLAVGELAGKRVGVPGEGTTAYSVLRLLAPDIAPVVVPITPFEAIFEALSRGDIDAGLIIHEGRLTYESRGLHRVAELGEWWQEETGLPLPLGGNVIRRALGDELLAEVSEVLRQSIAHGLEHRDEVMSELLGSGEGSGIGRAQLDRYLDMYANEDTLDYGEVGRRAVEELFRRRVEAGQLDSLPPLDWAP